jgi:hypothetical protein
MERVFREARELSEYGEFRSEMIEKRVCIF